MEILIKDTYKLVLISSIVALPAVGFFINNWLNNFAYKTPVSWLFFIIPIILLIAFYYGFFYLFKRESFAIIGGISSFLFYYIIIFLYVKFKKGIDNFRPFVTKK